MRPIHFILLAVALNGCSVSVPAQGPAGAPSSFRNIDSFRFIDAATTVTNVIAKLGAPDRDIGSGLHVYAYRLADGSEILIGSADGSEILYARHAQEVLFERR